MKNEISKKLLDLKFDPSYKGFYFLVEMLYVKNQNKISNLNVLYDIIAKENNTSIAAIGRNISTCIRKSNNEYKGKTVGEVVNTLSVILC